MTPDRQNRSLILAIADRPVTVWLLIEGVPHTSGNRSPLIFDSASLFYPAALKAPLRRGLERCVIARH